MTDKKNYPNYIIDDIRAGKDGQFIIMPEHAKGTLNPETIRGKLLWYTTEGGYDYCHPYSRAKERAERIANVLNKTTQQLKLESSAQELLEALIKARDIIGENDSFEWEYFDQIIKKATI